ncbi:hypothetical protein GY655_26480 [Escherichia coli]|nr:hypothetical protein [Escherichia coli]
MAEVEAPMIAMRGARLWAMRARSRSIPPVRSMSSHSISRSPACAPSCAPATVAAAMSLADC